MTDDDDITGSRTLSDIHVHILSQRNIVLIYDMFDQCSWLSLFHRCGTVTHDIENLISFYDWNLRILVLILIKIVVFLHYLYTMILFINILSLCLFLCFSILIFIIVFISVLIYSLF